MIFLWVTLALLGAFLSCALPGAPAGSPGSPVVRLFPVQLEEGDPGRKQVGDLEFLQGWELRSSDSRFGGISGLALSDDGNTLYAVSDNGYWLRANLHHDPDGQLLLVNSWEIAPLLGLNGTPVRGRLRDAEGLTRDRDSSFIVSFEQIHRLWRYPSPQPFTARPQVLAVPPELGEAPLNGGLEGIAILQDGQLLAITEQYKNPDGSRKGWLIPLARGDEGQEVASLSYFPSDGFEPTDLAALPSGDLLVLERRYTLMQGLAARLKWLSREWIRPGAGLKGREIAHLARPLTVDNFEGLAVRQDRHGRTLVYLISDDNYSPFQRTLLLQFRMAG